MKYRVAMEKSRFQRLSNFLMECFTNGKSPLSINSDELKNLDPLLAVLEAFDQRFKGGRWEEIKQDLSCHFLLPLARKRRTSVLWQRRLYAARCFALFPLKEDLSLILSLLKDPLFLVHSTAASAAIYLESEEAISLILGKLAKEKDRYSKCIHQDLLLKASLKVFRVIEQTALRAQEEDLHVACLDLLSSKIFVVDSSLLQRDLSSSNPNIANAALAIYANNPQNDSEPILLKALHHPDASMRQKASLGLCHYPSKESLEALERALEDPSMAVRLQAATSLKRLGELGIAILQNRPSSEVAGYALEFA